MPSNSIVKIFSALVASAVVLSCSTGPGSRADEVPVIPEATPFSVTTAAVAGSPFKVQWDIPALSKAPQTFPAPGFEKEGVEALFYQGLPYKGKLTRVFAYVGMPPRKGNEKVPAMVLVHGGGGTAFLDWVQLWNSRGYAAIAIDTTGATPKEGGGYTPHEFGGPLTWGGFELVNEPIQEQWTYLSVANIMLANSLLRARPEVDPNRIGLTGISWGGYLTCITAGVDQRFKFAAPIYGCGFLGDNSAWSDLIKGMGPDGIKWLGLWDPSRYLKNARMPFLWMDGTNDVPYPMDSLQKTYRLLPASQSTFSTRVRMPHGHGEPSQNPEEIHVFADHYLKGVPATLARIGKHERKGNEVTVRYTSSRPIVRAELSFTKDRGSWNDRNWDTTAALLDDKKRVATATLPEGVSVYFVNLIDDKGLIVSTQHVEVPAG